MKFNKPTFFIFAVILLSAQMCGPSQAPSHKHIRQELQGHSRADYMTGQIMQGNFSGALNTAVLPPHLENSNCPPSYPTTRPVSAVTSTERAPGPVEPHHPSLQGLIDNFPPGCGFHYKSTPEEMYMRNCNALNRISAGEPMENINMCFTTNCIYSAAFAMVLKLRDKPYWPSIRKDFWCGRRSNGQLDYNKGYAIFKGPNGVERLAKAYPQIGSAIRIQANSLDTIHNNQGKPKPGDLVRFQRNTNAPIKHSAHSGIFSHYKKSPDGKITELCYWSSFQGSSKRNIKSGHRVKCEPRSHISYVEDLNLDGQ